MRNIPLLCTLLFVSVFTLEGRGQDFDRVPGVVIDYEESPSLSDAHANVNEVYIASPSITIMPNGYYIASHDLFDSGTNYDTTKVFLSTDRGATWSHQSTIVGQYWSTVFENKGILYIFGPQRQGGNLIIRKSTDYGHTWTEPTSSTSGLLREGKFGGTPNAPAIHNGRIWIAQSGASSAPVDSDLLHADSWTLIGGISDTHGRNHFGDLWQGWSESQVVASPQTGVVLMPKIRALPHTALFRVDEAAGEVRFDGSAPNAFPSLPGGEKKFGARYDPVSKRFFVLSNPVLPVEADHPELAGKPEMIRTTAGVVSSKDLINWNVEKLFLYSPHIDDGTFGEGFQYFNFAIDGDDLAVVARSAIDVGEGENKPPRGHDTNLMTFHRIKDFRNLSPEHVLVLDTDGNQALRYEETQHKRAPLGLFALGSTFDGTPLTRPTGLAQAADGDVYVREEGGRVLRFDAAGNFLESIAPASGLPAEIRESLRGTAVAELQVSQPTKGECSWVAPESGDWSTATNWYYWGRPDTNEELAVFGSAANADCTIDVKESFTVKGLRFRNSAQYTIAGPGRLTVAAKAGKGVLELLQGNHEIQVAFHLASDVDLLTENGTCLSLSGPVALEGRRLNIGGSGRVRIGGPFSMGQGVLLLQGSASLVFEEEVKAKLDGTLVVELPERFAPQPGKRFRWIEGLEYVSGRFETVTLPELPAGMSWDTSSLYENGMVTIKSDAGS